MLSFHYLNYGPDPVLLPQSEFSATWEGWLTPDCTLDSATFKVKARGDQGKSLAGKSVGLWLDGKQISLDGRTPVSLVQGKRMKLRFEYSQLDETGQHPAFALQWDLQGRHAVEDAMRALNSADAVVAVVGGGMSSSTPSVTHHPPPTNEPTRSLALQQNSLAISSFCKRRTYERV